MNEDKSNGNIKYPAKQFYKDLREELEKIAPAEYLSSRYGLTDEIFSLILGQGRNHVSNKKNDRTQIALDLLFEYNLFIKARIKYWRRDNVNSKSILQFNQSELMVKKFIDNYKCQNILKKYARGISNVFELHPKLKTDYFSIIKTRSQAYWLGWLFAEGWISQYGESSRYKRPYYRFGVACSSKDSFLIHKFAEEIGFESNKIKTKIYETLKGSRELLYLRISNFDFAEYLKWNGFIIGNKKSKNIKFPILKNRKLRLAFLLGYFDGDGKMGTTQIASGSKIFLEQIKSKFEIKGKIRKQISCFYDSIKDRIVEGSTYIISLGPSLFNEMLINYSDSLKRKRIPKYTLNQRLEKANKARLAKN